MTRTEKAFKVGDGLHLPAPAPSFRLHAGAALVALAPGLVFGRPAVSVRTLEILSTIQ
jgi:hypothetical protein